MSKNADSTCLLRDVATAERRKCQCNRLGDTGAGVLCLGLCCVGFVFFFFYFVAFEKRKRRGERRGREDDNQEEHCALAARDRNLAAPEPCQPERQ